MLENLPVGFTTLGGFFGGTRYCIGVPVSDIAKAFELGLYMPGDGVPELGEIGFDRIDTQWYIVFRSAKVQQGA